MCLHTITNIYEASHNGNLYEYCNMWQDANPGLLLFKHLVENWLYPILERAIVSVRDEQVASTIHAALSKLRASPLVEVAKISRREALNDVLLDAARRRDDHIHLKSEESVQAYLRESQVKLKITFYGYHIMLCKKSNYIPESRGCAIWCKSQKYCAASDRTIKRINGVCFARDLMFILSTSALSMASLMSAIFKSFTWLQWKIVLCG